MRSSSSSSISDGATAESGTTQASALDGALADLLDLGLLAKQAHWNVVGPRFGPLHLLLDELSDFALGSADSVAERSVTLGRSPDGRAIAIVTLSSLPDLKGGPLPDGDVIAAFVNNLDVVTGRIHAALDAFAEDPVTVDLFTRVLAELEKLAWILRSYREQ